MAEGKKEKLTEGDLTAYEIAFIERYLIDFNAAGAWREAFPDRAPQHAKVKGCLMLQKPRVAKEIKKRLKERSAQIKVDTYYVVEKLLEVVNADFVDAVKYLSKEEFENLPEEHRRLIQSVKITRKSFRDTTEDIFQVTFMSKDKALELLGKHSGAFLKDEMNINVNLKGFADIVKEVFPEER